MSCCLGCSRGRRHLPARSESPPASRPPSRAEKRLNGDGPPPAANPVERESPAASAAPRSAASATSQNPPSGVLRMPTGRSNRTVASHAHDSRPLHHGVGSARAQFFEHSSHAMAGGRSSGLQAKAQYASDARAPSSSGIPGREASGRVPSINPDCGEVQAEAIVGLEHNPERKGMRVRFPMTNMESCVAEEEARVQGLSTAQARAQSEAIGQSWSDEAVEFFEAIASCATAEDLLRTCELTAEDAALDARTLLLARVALRDLANVAGQSTASTSEKSQRSAIGLTGPRRENSSSAAQKPLVTGPHREDSSTRNQANEAAPTGLAPSLIRQLLLSRVAPEKPKVDAMRQRFELLKARVAEIPHAAVAVQLATLSQATWADQDSDQVDEAVP